MRGSAVFRTGIAPGGALAGPWVRNPLWTRARAVPSLDLRFADNKSLTDAVTGASLITFTRASSGTFVDSAGVLQTAATDAPRFDHNPTTGESLGLLVEEARTNLLLNSATLSTQSVTVAAAANTLSFYGTGTVTLTGVSTAGPLVGTGTNNRVSLTFTPTVGVLVLTVSGSVTNAQLEAGAFPTSYIPTTTAAATRSADVASIDGSAFTSFYNQSEGTFFVDAAEPPAYVAFQAYLTLQGASNLDEIRMWRTGATTINCNHLLNNVSQGTVSATSNLIANRFAHSYSVAQGIASSANGGSNVQATLTSTIPTTVLRIGARPTASFYGNRTYKRIIFWPQALPSRLQALTQ